MYLLNKSVYFCWCSGTLQLRRPFSTQPKVSSISGTRCFHPSPAQPRPGEPSRKEPAPHRSSGHLLPSHTQVFHLRFVFTQALPTGKAPFSSGRPAAVWGSLGFVPGGYGCTDPPRSCKAPRLLALVGQGPVSVVSTM